MAESFDACFMEYLNEFDGIRETIGEKISEHAAAGEGRHKRDLEQVISGELASLERTLDCLKIEARMQTNRKEAYSIVKTKKTEVSTLKRRVLLSLGGGGSESGDDASSGRLKTTTSKAASGVDSLAKSRALLHETEEVGLAITEDLSRQRETLMRTKAKVEKVDDNLSSSSRLLRKMAKWWA